MNNLAALVLACFEPKRYPFPQLVGCSTQSSSVGGGDESTFVGYGVLPGGEMPSTDGRFVVGSGVNVGSLVGLFVGFIVGCIPHLVGFFVGSDVPSSLVGGGDGLLVGSSVTSSVVGLLVAGFIVGSDVGSKESPGSFVVGLRVGSGVGSKVSSGSFVGPSVGFFVGEGVTGINCSTVGPVLIEGIVDIETLGCMVGAPLSLGLAVICTVGKGVAS